MRQQLVDSSRVAVLGFSQGAGQALSSVERGIVERLSPNKFNAAIASYPHCLGFKGDMTVPTLILIGELDDWTLAVEYRNMVDGRDDWGISRQRDQGVPIKLIVPGRIAACDNAVLYRGGRQERALFGGVGDVSGRRLLRRDYAVRIGRREFRRPGRDTGRR